MEWQGIKLKKENWIYIFAFLCGVVIVNLLGSTTWENNSLLNRYSLVTLSFRELVYQEYFIQIILLRFRTVIGLWILTRMFPKKMVTTGFAILVSVMLGGVASMSILANGVWGICFFFSALLPHGIFYGLAYKFWCNMQNNDRFEGNRKGHYFVAVLIFMLMTIGCICEAYICPVLIENVLKY